jgi:hypothetical protein
MATKQQEVTLLQDIPGNTVEVGDRSIFVPEGMDGKTILASADIVQERTGIGRIAAYLLVIELWPLIAEASSGE